jgi:SAM-dependent methyltransferase
MDAGLELTSLAEPHHFWFRGFRGFVAPAIELAAAGRRDLRIVDCGCGTGFNLSLLQPFGTVCGFDLTRGGVRRARAAGHPVAHADITRIPLASDSVDLATAFDVLQCVEGDEQAVREMARIVRPGGAIVLTLAAFEFLRGDHSIVWHEVRRYTPGLARRLVEQAGLRVERVSFLFGSVFPVIVGARMVQRLLRPFRGVRGDADIRVPPAPVNRVLSGLLDLEARVGRRWPMPIGSSILVVCRRPES